MVIARLTQSTIALASPPAGTVCGGERRVPDGPRRSLPLFLLLLFTAAQVSGASLTARVDRSMVPVGESITLSLTFEGASVNAQPQVADMPNFRVTPSIGTRTEMQIINGRQTLKQTFEYTLLATRPGDAVIPGITARAGGTTLTSQPVQVKVVTATQAAAAQSAMVTNLAFLRLVVPKTEVYLGEPFPVEIHFYCRVGARDIQTQLGAEGFSTSALPDPTQSRTQIGGVPFNLAVYRTSARAARTGNLELGPATQQLYLFTRTDFFNRPIDARQVNLASETVPIRVLPLPTQGVPEGFNGAIGTYQLNVNAGPTTLAVGDPITVRVQISGSGPLDALTYPAQGDWRDFNVYPPTSKIHPTDPLNLSGSKQFEQVVIPQNHEIKQLPPFKFSFFDPSARSYRTLTGPSIPLNIRPTSGGSAPPPVLTNTTANAQAAENDIIHIRPHLELTATAVPWISRPWFLGLQIVPLALWLGLLIRRKRGESLASNPRLRRQREVALRVREGLKELKAHSAAGQSNEFFSLLFRLLQEQLGERLDMPATAITESVIDDKLRARGVPEETLKSLHELFQVCNLARYAPVKSSQELTALVPKLESVLRDLQFIQA